MTQLPMFTEPAPALYPVEPIVREALIEDNYRRWLKRAWGSGPCIGWAMLNPSLASGERDDPTLKRIIGFSYRWGFGSLVVGNVYPFVSPNQAALRKWRQSFAGSDPDHSAREAFIRNAYDCAGMFSNCQLVMAAWGNGADADDLDRWRTFVETEIGWPGAWHCLGTTNGGAPKHPLARGRHRIPDDAEPMIWRQTNA